MEFDYTSTTASTPRVSAPPLSIKEIADKATQIDFNTLIPLKYWLRTAENLRKEADIYLAEGNDQHAYLLLVRWVELILQYICKHPDSNNSENVVSIIRLQNRVPEAIAILERLKPGLEARYRSYLESRRATSSPGRRKDAPAGLDLASRLHAETPNGPFSPPRAKSPPPHDIDSRNLALDIARQEYEKREREKRERRLREARDSGGVILDHTGREIRRVGAPATPAFPYKRIFGGPPQFETPEQREERQAREAREDDEELIESIKALSMGMTLPPRESRTSYQFHDFSERDSISAYDFEGFPQEPPSPVKVEPTASRWTASYPAVPKPQHISPPAYSPAARPLLALPPPPPPPKIPAAPALPPKIRGSSPAPVATLADATQSMEFSTPATLESGEPLRTMFLPSKLRQAFLTLAAPNTNANLETCGILCGTLIQNALFVSRLVIPEQEATSDTCATKDEEGFFEYCSREELMVLGWIHTHPTQTCFMSSVDLHTHAGYQLMMKESIAIVCAPSKNPSWGVFRLTDPPGVQTIVNCRQKGLFHPHVQDSVYTDAMRPGHVCIVEDMAFEIVDMRKQD